ncbi:MAG: GNAT family N-acetyltransferase [Phycisphaerales bacterium]
MNLLTTPRLLVRTLVREDAAALASWRSDEDVARYVPWTPPCSAEQAATLIERVAAIPVDAPGNDGLLLGVVHTGGERHTLIGEAMIRHDGGDARQCVIGYALHADAHGRGLATELTVGLLGWCFDQAATHRVTAWCDARNHASVRVLEKAGMRQEARFVQGEFAKGEWVDELVYAMLKSEWPAAAAGPPHRRVE